MAAVSESSVVVLPDAGPLITLAYADALDLLLKPGWPVHVVDMVLHEVTRNKTPSSEKIGQWVERQAMPPMATRVYRQYRAELADKDARTRKANLGEIAIQETMNEMALGSPDTTGVFLFEDHKIARASFLLPANCRKISPRAWLMFLEGQGWIVSAAEIERAAIANGMAFSRLRFPP